MAPQGYGTGEASEDVKHPPISKPHNGLVKTQVSFGEDLKNFAEGTVPQSIIVALVIGTFDSSSCNLSKSEDINSTLTNWPCFLSLFDRNCMRNCCQHLLQNSLWST